MIAKSSKVTIYSSVVSVALLASFNPAHAQSAGEIGAGIIIGCVTGLLNCQGKQTKSSSSQPSPQRLQNMEVQKALNGFNWPVGAVDGVMGARSQSAIADYQGYMGYPRTGQLTDYERNVLVDSWDRYNSGAGAAYPSTMGALGPRGMLKVTADPSVATQYGDANPYAPQQQQAAVQPVPQQQLQPQQQVPQQQVPQQQIPQQTQPVTQQPTMIAPLKPVEVNTSMASDCEVTDLTAQSVGPITAETMTDPELALDVKFCEARSFAISQSNFQASQFAVSENELLSTCAQIASSYSSTVGSLNTSDLAQVRTAAKSTAAALGVADPSAATAYGQICLGLGYQQDDAAMVMGGAMLLISADYDAYSEILGHHLRKGFGVTASAANSTLWYQDAISKLDAGSQPAFEPSRTKERVQIIQSAITAGGVKASGSSGGLPPLKLQQ